jgi:hypothetical protein
MTNDGGPFRSVSDYHGPLFSPSFMLGIIVITRLRPIRCRWAYQSCSPQDDAGQVPTCSARYGLSFGRPIGLQAGRAIGSPARRLALQRNENRAQ